MAQNLPAMRETWVWFLGWEDALEESMATHSSENSCLGIPQGVDKGLSFFTLYTHILFACFKVLNNQVLWQKIFTKIPHSPNKYTCVYCTPGIMLEAGNTAVKWQTRFTVHTPYHTPGQIFTKQLRATTHSRRHTLRFPASPSDLTLTSSSKRET